MIAGIERHREGVVVSSQFLRALPVPLVKSGTVQHIVNIRLLRAVTTACVLLAQVHLLWVAGLHRHDAVTFPERATSLLEYSPEAQTAFGSVLFCTACQIVRQSAALPATGKPAPQPVASNLLRTLVPPSDFHSHQPTVVFGRAPPLS